MSVNSPRTMPTQNHEFAIGHAVQEIHPVETNKFENEPNQQYSNCRTYDVMPPGVEPPPPGFENEAPLPQSHRYSREREWNTDYKNEAGEKSRASRSPSASRHQVSY